MISRVESARYMAAHIPGARYIELPGDDHLPFVGNQDEMLTPVEELLGASHPTTGPDRVLATVLALEIADTAQVMAAVGQQRRQDVQETYAGIVRRALDLTRGRAVTTASGGFLATFDGPSRAIRCAQTIVEESAPLGILPRGGLHTGECDLVNGEPSGLALRVAAWVMSGAHAGEILSSNTVRDLVSGSGITFDEANTRAAAPGPGGTWRVFRIDSRQGTIGGGAKSGHVRLPSRVNASLTPREREVVGLLARGRTNREIADTLTISERTVENHVSNVLGKLGLETRAQVAIWALRRDETPTSVFA